MNTQQKAALMIRSLMRDAQVDGHIVFPKDEPSFSSYAVLADLEHDPIVTLSKQMFAGWIYHEASYKDGVAGRSQEDAMTEACGGDNMRANLLCVFGHWSNDIVAIAAHYGVGLARKQPDGSLLYSDGTVDTLMRGGQLTIVEVPPAPSPRHWFNAGVWNEPSGETP